MKKLLAILMALAMMLSLAACGDKEDKKDDETTTVAADAGKDANEDAGEDAEENKEADTASDEKAIKAAVEAYYAAIVSYDGTKIKATMPKVMETLAAGEFNPNEFTADDAAQIKDFYGFDIYSADAAFSFLAIGAFERFDKVNSITVDNVKFEKFTAAELKEENDSVAEYGCTFLDGANVDVVITIVPSEGKETVTNDKLTAYKEESGWKIIPSDEEDGTTSSSPVTPDVTPGANTVVPETPTNAGTVVTPPVATNNEDAQLKAAANAYYTAMASYNGAGVKNSLSALFTVTYDQQDVLAGITAAQIAEKEAEFGVNLSDAYAGYTVFALSVMTEVGDVASVQVTDIRYEKIDASEIADLNAQYANSGVTGVYVSDYAEGEVDLFITFADGTTNVESQDLLFAKENGTWKVFPAE